MTIRSELTFASDELGATSLESDSPRIRTVVVDDSDTFIRVTCDLLDREDVIDLVAAASDGAEAVDTVARLKPELVLMEVSLPGLNGLETASLLSEMSPAPAIVLMSSENTPQLRAACWRAGAFGFIHKANFRDELEAVLQRILQRDESGQSLQSA